MTLVLLVLTLRMRAVLPPEPHHVPPLEINQEETDLLKKPRRYHRPLATMLLIAGICAARNFRP